MSFDNFLPNVQWQLWTGTGFITKMNYQGTGTQAPIYFVSFDPSWGQPQLYSTDLQQVRVGDIGYVSFAWRYAGIGTSSAATAVRVVAAKPGTSITVQSNFDGLSPATSTAGTFTPITPGDLGSGTGQAADGWKKSGSLIVWADDWPCNTYPGAIRVLGLRKGSANPESLSWTVPPNQLTKYRGRTVTFGVNVYQKAQGGAGTWTIEAADGTQTIPSRTGTGASIKGYQFVSVTINVSPNATGLTLSLKLSGIRADVYYLALPTACFSAFLSQTDCAQNPNEMIRPVGHWNPPLLTPFRIQFPNTCLPGAPGLYGWQDIDLEAISMGTCHNSVSAVKAKIEWLTSSVGAYIFTGTRADYSLIFGPQAVTQVANVNDVGQGWLPLDDKGRFALFSGTANLVPTTGTFDFDMVQLSMPSSAN